MNDTTLFLTCPGCRSQLEFVRGLSYGKMVRCYKCRTMMLAVDGDEEEVVSQEKTPSPHPKQQPIRNMVEKGIRDSNYVTAILVVSVLFGGLAAMLVFGNGHHTITGQMMLFFLTVGGVICLGLLIARPPAGGVSAVSVVLILGMLATPFVLMEIREVNREMQEQQELTARDQQIEKLNDDLRQSADRASRRFNQK